MILAIEGSEFGFPRSRIHAGLGGIEGMAVLKECQSSKNTIHSRDRVSKECSQKGAPTLRSKRSRSRRCSTFLVAAAVWAGCNPPLPIEPGPTSLVERFTTASVLEPASVSPVIEPVLWSFDSEQELPGWQVGSGVEELRVSDGRLTGRATGDFPILHAVGPQLPIDDELHSVEIRMRASAGTQVSLEAVSKLPPDWRGIQEVPFPWPISTPLLAGEEEQLYTLRPSRTVRASDIRHLLLRPTNQAGDTFEISSIRLVFRREHLASLPAGVSWQGLGDVFRETVVSRAGEVLSFHLDLPAHPWLDLAVGSLDTEPVTFEVGIETEGGSPETLLQETVSEPEEWQPVVVDLERFSGSAVALTLRVTGRAGAVGFWGAPTVRSREVFAGEQPRGVIVIVGDTLRRDHLPFYGYERDTAPNLRALAEEGAVMEDTLSQATWTKASVPSIFTSMYPTTHGVRQFTDRLPAAADTLAEVYRRAGYATLGMSSIVFTGRFTNLHQGYEEFHESTSLPKGLKAKTARHYVDRLLPWIERQAEGRFFVFLHVADPHSPYEPYEPYDILWGVEGGRETYHRQQDEVRPEIADPMLRRFGMPSRGELEAAGVDPEGFVQYELDAYDGSIRAMDEEIGRLLTRLRQLGLEDEVLVAFVSDHGTEFLDHDRHFHGHSVYGELNRVPMMLWGPGRVPAGVRLADTVETLDLMPTLLELSGLEIPAGAQGQSLVQAWRGSEAGGTPGAWQPRPAVTEKAATDSEIQGRSEVFSIVSDGWKLVQHHVPGEEAPLLELYDHRQDPLNTVDLASAEPARVRELARQLALWREKAESARLLSDAELGEGLSGEELERLRSLGYVQ